MQRETSALYKKSGVNPTAGGTPPWAPAGKVISRPLLFLCGLAQGTAWGVCDCMEHGASRLITKGRLSLADACEHCCLLRNAFCICISAAARRLPADAGHHPVCCCLVHVKQMQPRAGCLPTLATIPMFWGLYRTLSNASSDGALTGGFYWLPDLAGPTSLAAQKAGAQLPACSLEGGSETLNPCCWLVDLAGPTSLAARRPVRSSLHAALREGLENPNPCCCWWTWGPTLLAALQAGVCSCIMCAPTGLSCIRVLDPKLSAAMQCTRCLDSLLCWLVCRVLGQPMRSQDGPLCSSAAWSHGLPFSACPGTEGYFGAFTLG